MKRKTRYETFLSRFLAVLMVFIMCMTLFPAQAYAWKNLTHVNSADIILLELKRAAAKNNGKAAVTIYDLYDDQSAGYTYEIPQEFKDALFSYPDAFRAGSMGPDFYPDMLTGQGYIHPYDDAKNIGSGEWVTLLCESVNRLPYGSNERKEALAFTLGFMLHFCGDEFGHDFINQFAGGTYPFLADAANEASSGNVKGPNLNIIFSHMATETYMDSLLDWDFYARNNKQWLKIKAPTRFVTDTLVFDGSVNSGAAKIFKRYGSVPAMYTYLIDFRQQLYTLANEWRESTEVFTAGAVKFIDRWVEDLDKATYAFVECFDNMARRMVTTKPSELSTMTVVREELMKWKDDYGSYITPVPDVVVDSAKITKEITTAITDALNLQFVKDINKWIEDQVIDIALNAMGMGSLLDVVDGATERMEDPSVQLDHEDNPFKPAENNFAEFKEYMDRYAKPQKELAKYQSNLDNYGEGESPEILDKLIDSDLEAFYNTMVMFKLILIGPENFEDLINKLTGNSYSGSKRPSDYYHGNTGYLTATSLKLKIKTLDASGAGTDDNIFAVVFDHNDGQQVAKKLLDISNYNDFERGDNDEYIVELSRPLRCDQIDINIQQRKPSGLGGGVGTEWDCENIKVTPMHAGKELHGAISVGGKTMNTGDNWDLEYREEVLERMEPPNKMTVTRLNFEIKTKENPSILYTYGTDANVTVAVYEDTGNPLFPRYVGSRVLNRPKYNDFESGDHDYYDVYLSSPVTLDKMVIHFFLDGLDDDWTPEYIKLTPYHRDIKLANSTTVHANIKMKKGELHTMDLKNIKPLSITPIPRFDYETALDDGLASYVNSLDDSRQWINDSILWNDKTVREEVFFKIFKGFAPEIGYSGPERVTEGEAVDMEISFTGMWNGIRQARRDAVSPNSPMPAVKGSARISFLNEKGEEACYLDRDVDGGSISVSDYANEALKAGVYDIKVTFAPDSGDPQYSGAERVFEKALMIEGNSSVKNLDVVGVVNWDGDDDQQDMRPEIIMVHLLANNTKHTSQEVKESKSGLWAFSFDNLPAADAQGNIDYTIAVDDIPGYTTKVEKESDTHFVVTNTLNGASKHDYTVKFEANVPADASTTCEGSMEDQSFGYYENKPLSTNGYSLPGYDFAGWNTKADGTGAAYTDGQEVERLSETGGTVTLYAQWVRDGQIIVTVTKDGVPQSGLEGKFSLIDGSGTKLSVPILYENGKYTFDTSRASLSGISMAPLPEGEYTLSFSDSTNYFTIYPEASKKIVYGPASASSIVFDYYTVELQKDPVYTVSHNITIHGAFRPAPPGFLVLGGTKLTIRTTVFDSGYIFDRYTADGVAPIWENGDPTKTEQTIQIRGKTTITAHLTPAEHSVSVVGGTADKATAKPGETVTITADPPAEGKAFVQWPHVDGVDYAQMDSVKTTFKMPAKNVELTPVYADILIPDIADQTYTGEPIEIKFGLFNGVKLDGVVRQLVQGTNYEITYDKNIDAGEATLTVTMKAPSAGSKTATFKILPVDIEVTTGSAKKDVYDGTPLTCQTGVEITGLLSGETATVRATGSQTDVGTSDNTYEIEWGTAKADNYNVAKETLGTLTVASPKAVTVTANDASKTYGEDDPDLTATPEGLIGSDTVNYTLSRETGENVGTYVITPTGEAAQGNYTVSFAPGTFTIRQRQSGGGGGVSTYAITIEKPENGSLTASRTTAPSGAKITVKAVPNEGFETDFVKVTDRSGNEIAAAKNDDGDYTFTMPDSNVTVKASFKEKGRPSEHLRDVDENAWYREYVDYVVEKGLMQGVADDLFAPDVTTSRAMIVTILHRLEGRPAVSGASPFDDVASGQWYTDAVIWAEANGIVEGYGNGKFGSNDLITREQFAAIMYRYANFKGYDTGKAADLAGYEDASEIGDWALAAMKWANAEKLITGRTTTTLVPKGEATRAEAAAILKRFIENVK